MRGLRLGLGFGSTVPLGPELFTGQVGAIDNSGGGAVYTWDAPSRTMTVTTAGTNTSYPRIIFSLGLVTGATYRVYGTVTGNGDMVSQIRLASVGVANNVPYTAASGVFSGDVVAADSVLQVLSNGTIEDSYTITLISVRRLFV